MSEALVMSERDPKEASDPTATHDRSSKASLKRFAPPMFPMPNHIKQMRSIRKQQINSDLMHRFKMAKMPLSPLEDATNTEKTAQQRDNQVYDDFDVATWEKVGPNMGGDAPIVIRSFDGLNIPSPRDILMG